MPRVRLRHSYTFPDEAKIRTKKKKKKNLPNQPTPGLGCSCFHAPCPPLSHDSSSPPLIRQDSLNHIDIVQLAGAGIDGFQQLVHLLIAHLLAQVREDVAELAHADEARQVLVEDLEPPAVVFGFAGVAEAAWTVQDLGEGVEVDWEKEERG